MENIFDMYNYKIETPNERKINVFIYNKYTLMGKNNFVSLCLKEEFILYIHKICLDIQDKINKHTSDQVKFIPMD